MSEYTDKLQEWVDSVKMCEAAGIEPCYKYVAVFGQKSFIRAPGISTMKTYPEKYTFPIAVVEGKPVFVGDELYNSLGEKIIVTRLCNGGTALESKFPASNGCMCETLNSCSWNPPKPKTVMVELRVDYAEFLVNRDESTILATACRKALREQNG